VHLQAVKKIRSEKAGAVLKKAGFTARFFMFSDESFIL